MNVRSCVSTNSGLVGVHEKSNIYFMRNKYFETLEYFEMSKHKEIKRKYSWWKIFQEFEFYNLILNRYEQKCWCRYNVITLGSFFITSFSYKENNQLFFMFYDWLQPSSVNNYAFRINWIMRTCIHIYTKEIMKSKWGF